MNVTQPDSRSIRIVSETGVRLSVPYRFFWNGHERPAESIVLAEGARGRGAGVHDVRAFFLFGEIRDRITEDKAGITLSRTWSMKTPGSVHLDIDLELDPAASLSCLFPGVQAFHGLPSSARSFLAERTACPAGLFVALGKKGFLVFSPSARCGADHGSIGIARTDEEDEPARLRVRLRFPGLEEPASRIGPGPQDLTVMEETFIESPGSLERSHELCLAFSSRDEIALRGLAAVLQRVGPGPVTGTAEEKAADASADRQALADALKMVLDRHLCRAGGVLGLRETPDARWISASAGAGCAVGLVRMFPDDARLVETALQLADFALKGQVPWGSFYESYNVSSGRWRGVRGRSDLTLLSVGQSATIADHLLSLSEELARIGRPHEKYFLAGLRFIDFFLDEKGKLSPPGGLQPPAASEVHGDAEPGLAGLELVFPLARVLAKTGRDRYKKALDLLARRFSGIQWDVFEPPTSREGRGSDSAGALLAARLFVRMRELGYRPVEPPASGAAARARALESAQLFASLLVPWVRLQDSGSDAALPAGRGCLHDSYARQRLLCAGRETALLLLRLSALTAAEDARLLTCLAKDCLASARRFPIGTSFIRHTTWESRGEEGRAGGRGARKGIIAIKGQSKPPRDGAPLLGPVDSRRVASEVLYGLQLLEEPRA